MSILVPGGAGYIGSHTAKALKGAGYEPLVYDIKKPDRWPRAIQGQGVHADLADLDQLRKVLREHRIDAVVHFAAFIEVGESVEHPGKYFRNNFVNSLRLLDAMTESGVRLIIFSSSAAIYGNPQEIPIPEAHPQNPTSPYGETKLMVERALYWYGKAHGLKWVALRYFNAAGSDGELGEEHDPETHLVPLTIQAAFGRRPDVKVFGTDYPTPDGTAVRDYIHVADLAEAHVRALQYLEAGGESVPLNLGTGVGHSVREVIAAVERIGGRSVPSQDTPRRPGDPPILVADPSQASQILHWNPAHSDLDAIVRSACDWHTSQWGVDPRDMR